MQNIIQKFRQSSIVFEKPGILSENLKTLRAPATLQFNIFCWTSHTFSTYQCLQKGVRGFFISFRSWVICKNLKRPGFYTLVFYTFINNSVLNKIKQSHTPFCRHYWVENVCTISATSIKLCGSWSWSKFSIFQTKSLLSWK